MRKYTIWFVFVLFIFYLGLFSFHKIDLTTADLGRHLTNGAIFLNPKIANTTRSTLLNTNFYSYTHPNYSFVNHHWGSGVLFFILFSFFGFNGLSLFYFFCIAGALILITLAVKDGTDTLTLILCAVFLIPLIADRAEVRPEGISYFFLALFFFLLYRFSNEKTSWKYLFILPVFELLWANMHIYFIFGIYIIGIFLCETAIPIAVYFVKNLFKNKHISDCARGNLLYEEYIRKQRKKIKKLGTIFILTSIVTLLNPYGLKAVIYPFTIFQNYGYRIVENQSIPFLESISFTSPSFLWYKITLCLITISSVFIAVRIRKSFMFAPTILVFTFAVFGYMGIRHIATFSLFALPLTALNLCTIKQSIKKNFSIDTKITIYGLLYVFVALITLLCFFTRLPWMRDFGLGLTTGNLDSVRFIQKHKLHGPIFNNYDIGGLAIFSLFPQEKVFVDNRPEAYPKEFFSNIYVQMQENDTIWNAELKKENFNMIYFYRLDYTPWAQAFLIKRIADSAWAPVFVDKRTIIFLKRTPENKKTISTFELPKQIFSTK